ncbi:TolC family protein [Mucilaginibacter ginsenosidivorans]|uniref:TolC family protein n=1 Tax=Mucilaginibacter ginsenosidivorans TaxID=398053 RepID=A0A5B8UZ59_9SPHI|nr:TolC family protein [Mucilaginibacter ginsenosidivorans]QEC64497.1 TolC family protein [Mucilaginibacter ginsenosidivorans]
MKHLLLISLLLIGIASGASAQQAPPAAGAVHSFSLQDCINYAYEHQDSVVNAGLDVKSAEYKIKETKATGLPQINGSVTFQDYTRAPVQVGPDFSKISSGQPLDPNARLVAFPIGPVQYNNTFALQGTQLLFSGTFLVGLQAAKTYKELSVRSLTRSKIQTNVSVTKAYYQVLVSNEQIKLLDANIAQLKQQLDQTTQQNKQGFVEKIDVNRLEVQYNNLTTNRENVVRALTLNYQVLKFQMGMPIQEELSLTDKLENINLDEQSAQNNIDTAFYHNRIEYNLLETNLKLNQLDVKSKKAAYLPTLSANAGLATTFQENQTKYLYGRNYPYNYVGLSLNIPIFSSGERVNQLRQSQINVQKAQNDLNNVKNAMSLEASSANITYSNNLRSLNSQKRSRELAAEVLRVSKIKYQQGVGSSIEVTQAQTDFENADNQYIQALYNALVSKVDLDKAYGKIQ